MSSVRSRLFVLAVALTLACDGTADGPTGPRSPRLDVGPSTSSSDATLDWLKTYLALPHAPVPGEPAVLAGAGDIARCYPGSGVRQYRYPGPTHPAARTAHLLEAMPGATVLTAGDNAYEFGSPFDYLFCYHPTWGRLYDRTRPSAGNHEYLTPGAAGYFAYFGRRSAPPLGYYSYDIGSWHAVVLNSTPQVYACWPPEADEPPPPGFPSLPVPSEPDIDAGRACAGDVAQQAWLANDLATHPNECTVVYFHHPRFSSGHHGNHFQMQRIWDLLYAFGADVVVDGHDHLYERFAPQRPDATPDTDFGIRQFTVGTGGGEFYDVSALQPNSEVVVTGVHGVIALALGAGSYAWAFEGTDGAIHDSGSGACHGAPAPL
jgi:acid phosphatase type 7